VRTTINIDDKLLRSLKAEAERSGTSLTQFVNRVLEIGLMKMSPPSDVAPRPLPTFSMGDASFPLDKALRFASDLEDEEIVRKLDLRK
jgi:hypothetical protein